ARLADCHRPAGGLERQGLCLGRRGARRRGRRDPCGGARPMRRPDEADPSASLRRTAHLPTLWVAGTLAAAVPTNNDREICMIARLRRLIAGLLIVCIAGLGLPLPVHAGIVSTGA